jgi:hypothetical protein
MFIHKNDKLKCFSTITTKAYNFRMHDQHKGPLFDETFKSMQTMSTSTRSLILKEGGNGACKVSIFYWHVIWDNFFYSLYIQKDRVHVLSLRKY